MPSTFNDIVDGVSTSLAIKAPVQVASTTHLALSGLAVVGSTQTTEGMRVLVNAQNDAVDNGIYKASSGAWQRAADFNGARDAAEGALVFVNSSDTYYRLTATNPVVIGTSDITWVEMAIAAATAAYYANYAALAAVYGVVGDQQVLVGGRTIIGDGGAGLFRWNAASTADPIIGLVINPVGNVGAGRWERLYAGPVIAAWIAEGDGTTDDTDVFEAIIDAGFLNLQLNEGKSYKITRTLELPTAFSLLGPPHGWINTGTASPKLLWRPAGADTACIRGATGALGHRIENIQIDIDDAAHSGIALTHASAYSGAIIKGVSFVGTLDVGIWLSNAHSNTVEDITLVTTNVKRACIYFGLVNTTTVRRLYSSVSPAEVATAAVGISVNGGSANVFEDCVFQGLTVGIWLNVSTDTVIRNPYTENTICSMSLGNPTGGSLCTSTSIYGGHFRNPFPSHSQYASRGPVIFINRADYTTFYSPHMVGGSVSDAAMAGFVVKSSGTVQRIGVHAGRFFGSDFRTEFMVATAGANPSLTATGVDYNSEHAQEIILKSSGAFSGVSHGIRVDNSGVVSGTVFSPPVFGSSVSALLDAAFPTIASV